MQRDAGIADDLATRMGLAIRGHLREQQRLFFPQLAFVLVGAVDPEGTPWATLHAGAPGFLSTPDERTLHVAHVRDPADPANRGLEEGDAVGLLGIELEARRRNRVNGRLRGVGVEGFDVAVENSFGNCSRFIWPRQYVFARPPGMPSGEQAFRLDRLTADAASLVAAADTFFVASYADLPDGRRQVDVSHRGGPAGFVTVSPDGSLVIPDYPGNNYYNTLGNLCLNGRAGLLFVDFPTGDVLQLTGSATIQEDVSGQAAAMPSKRSWTLRPERIVLRRDGAPLRWRDA